MCFVTPKDAAIFAPALTKSNDSVAQLVEHNTFNVGVLGSSPSGITKAGKPAFFIYKGSAQYNQGYFLLKLGSVSSQVFPNDYF